jgi:hypothetical protein
MVWQDEGGAGQAPLANTLFSIRTVTGTIFGTIRRNGNFEAQRALPLFICLFMMFNSRYLQAV